MRPLWIGCALAAGLAGCQSAPAGDIVVSGMRDQLKARLATVPYQAPDAEICAIATAVLVRAAQAEPEPADPHVGALDCGETFAAAGFELWLADSGRTFRRVSWPGVLADGMLLAGVDYGCTPSMCLGGTSYVMAQEVGVWVVRDEAVTWIR